MFLNQVQRLGLCVTMAFSTSAIGESRAQEATMIVTHEVEDFDRWQLSFDGALPIRRNAGELGSYIFHNPTNRNRVTVWFEWDSLEKARAFASDPMLADAMRAAGVISAPIFSIRPIEPSH